MGSVIEYEECPNCKFEESFMTDFYYKTGEEFGLCSKCGCTHSHFIKRDVNGKPLLIDPEKKCTFDNIVFESSENFSPFGASRLKLKDHIATQVGTLIEERDYLEFKKYCDTHKDIIESAVVSRFADSYHITETLI